MTNRFAAAHPGACRDPSDCLPAVNSAGSVFPLEPRTGRDGGGSPGGNENGVRPRNSGCPALSSRAD